MFRVALLGYKLLATRLGSERARAASAAMLDSVGAVVSLVSTCLVIRGDFALPTLIRRHRPLCPLLIVDAPLRLGLDVLQQDFLGVVRCRRKLLRVLLLRQIGCIWLRQLHVSLLDGFGCIENRAVEAGLLLLDDFD